MNREVEIEKVRRKFQMISPTLSERERRLWVGAEAEVLGRGGVAWAAEATGMAISTVRAGRDELRAGARKVVRDRRAGAGRPRLEQKDVGLVPALEALVTPATRGSPENPLLWTCKSTRRLSRELSALNHPVGANKVAQILKNRGYSLQAVAKTKEGEDHPDRDAQFEFINERSKEFMSRGLPVISVDAKKKEMVGDNANRGREWQLKGRPIEVRSHDYFDLGTPKATPYGVYDVAKNVGFVNVGTSNNTPAFAVQSIEKWWDQMGSKLYATAGELFVTADAGGSNSPRSTVWKAALQSFSDRTGLTIHVSHFPPGTSKWNKIEHRLFSFITLNWRGRVLATYETVVSLIAATTTTTGLAVTAVLDRTEYALGGNVAASDLAQLRLERAPFHGDWNYCVRPRDAGLTATPVPINSAPPVVSLVSRRERWLKLILEQRESGLSQRRFCLQHGINRDAFSKAARRLRKQIRRAPKVEE